MFIYNMFLLEGRLSMFVFPILSILLLYPEESFAYNFKTTRKKRFFNGATLNWFLYVTV